MTLLATNYDGVLPMILLGMLTAGLLMAAPFFVYYPIMVSVARGWRRSSRTVVLMAVAFVVLSPGTGLLALWVGSRGDLPFGALALTMGLIPSLALGLALLVDAESFPAALTPPLATLGVALVGMLTPVGEGFPLMIFAVIGWHFAVGTALRLSAVPRWRAQARPKGVCPACGYNLAGLPPGPCPECGVAAGGSS